MDNREAELKQYFRRVRKALPGARKFRDRVMQQLQDSVNSYLEENPDVGFDAIQAHFGMPQDIAAAYVESEDAAVLVKRMHIKKKIVAVVVGVLAAFLAIWFGVAIWGACDAKDRHNGGAYATVGEIGETTVIEE